MKKEESRETDILQDELLLHEQFGKASHFRVPEGYFDHLAENIMARLPQEEQAQIVQMQPSVWKRYRPAMFVAASILAAIFTVGMYTGQWRQESAVGQSSAGSQVYANQMLAGDVDDMADYAMMDNEEIYAYVSGY